MIEARIRPGRLEIKGHAGAGPKGEDIVCAAASMLAYALAAGLSRTEGDMRARLDEGYALIEAADMGPERAGMYTMAEAGLMGLAEKEPERVRVRRE